MEFSETLLREGNILEILSAVINTARELLRLGVHDLRLVSGAALIFGVCIDAIMNAQVLRERQLTELPARLEAAWLAEAERALRRTH